MEILVKEPLSETVELLVREEPSEWPRISLHHINMLYLMGHPNPSDTHSPSHPCLRTENLQSFTGKVWREAKANCQKW